MASNIVRVMRMSDAASASAISAEAGRRFATVADPRIAACADDSPFTVDELSAYIDASRAWVATECDRVVGFAIVDMLDGVPHIEEIDVARSQPQRLGIQSLLEQRAREARVPERLAPLRRPW